MSIETELRNLAAGLNDPSPTVRWNPDEERRLRGIGNSQGDKTLSIETEALRDLTERLTPAPRDVPEPASTFEEIRARTRGAIIAAHRDLELDWSETDDRMLDMVTVWLDSRGRRP